MGCDLLVRSVQDDGRFHCLGRIDRQLKLRGVRLEPSEVEFAFGRHPSVEYALVTMCDHILVAYVSGSQLDVAELRVFVREHLPDYMVPGQIVLIDSWPKLANGKVDVAALPDVNVVPEIFEENDLSRNHEIR